MGSLVSVVRHLIQGTEITWRFLAIICSCHQNRLFLSSDGYLILKKIV